DLAEALGCGGHLVELRRVKSGRFGLEDTISIQNLKRENISLIPIGEAISHIKTLNVGKEAATQIKSGKQVKKSYLDPVNVPSFEVGDKLKICLNSELVCVAEALVSFSDLDKLDDKTAVLRLLRVFNC
ncbi:MAG: hypothetical protein ACRENF_03895, partial [Thermodesulfobacteriota bacterium]